MNKMKCVAWLYQELPLLIQSGVLPPEVAGRLRGYYGEVNPRRRMQLALTIFGVVGAVCIGLGIILLFAYNWDTLTRGQRTVLAFVPLVIASGLCLWTVFRNNPSVAAREGSAVFNMLALGGALALITQIYHLPGDIDRLLLGWMLLSLPLIYLLSSSLVAVLYMIGLTTWAAMAQISGGHAILFWPLLAGVVPHYLKHLSRDRYGSVSVWLSSAICLCLTVSIGITLEKVLPGLWIIVYSAFYAVLYMVGRLRFDDGPALWQRPFRNYGLLGITILSYLLTFEWVWEDIGWRHYRTAAPFHAWAGVADYVITIALVVMAVGLLVRLATEKGSFAVSFAVMPILAVVAYSFSGLGGNEVIAVWIYNLYVLYLGILCVATGIRQQRLGMTNAGILILGVMIFTRFVDASLGIMARGIIFIVIGACFVGANMFFSRRIKGQEISSGPETKEVVDA